MLAFIPLLLNAGIFAYVFVKLSKSALHVSFACFLLTLCAWQMSDIAIRLSVDEMQAARWYDLLNPLTHFLAPLALHFALVFTQKERYLSKPWVLCSIYGLSIFFLLANSSNLIKYVIVESPFWNYIFLPADDFITHLSAYWLGAQAWVAMIIFARFVFKTKGKGKIHKQAMLVAIGFGIPAVQGIITELLFPYLFHRLPIPITTLCMSTFSLCIIIALTKFKLFSYSAKHAWKPILENIQDGVVIVDCDMRIRFTNPSFSQLLEHEHEDLLEDVFIKDLLELPHDVMPTAKTRSERRINTTFLSTHGIQKHCEVSVSPYKDEAGTLLGAIFLVRDITQQVIALQSESKLSVILESTSDLVSFADINGKLAYLNPSGLKMMHLRAQDEVSRFKLENLYPKWLDPQFKEMVWDQILENGYWQGQIGFETLRGKTLHTSTIIMGHRNSDGEVQFISTISRDISEHILLQAKLEQKIRDLNTFAYRTSHDLRNPLSSIQGLTTLAKDQLRDTDAIRFLELIEASAEKLDTITLDLANLTSIYQIKVKSVIVPIGIMISYIYRNLSHLEHYDKVRFDNQVDPEEMLIADEGLLTQILTNLITNAVHYADLSKDDPQIVVTLRRSKRKTRISIKDNGVGIPKKHVNNIFDMFYKSSHASNGSGLGLFIVRNAAERLNWETIINSREKEGTSITLIAPAFVPSQKAERA